MIMLSHCVCVCVCVCVCECACVYVCVCVCVCDRKRELWVDKTVKCFTLRGLCGRSVPILMHNIFDVNEWITALVWLHIHKP